MSIDPSEIRLTPNQQAYLAHQAEQAGTPWQELLIEILPGNLVAHESDLTAIDPAGAWG